jgi:hypothetical protein
MTITAALGTTSGLPATLWGAPVVRSANSPTQITLLDTSAILYADEGGFDVGLSRNASARLSTTPAHPATATDIFRSFWQDNLVGIRAVRWVNWLRADDGAVSYMTVAY